MNSRNLRGYGLLLVAGILAWAFSPCLAYAQTEAMVNLAKGAPYTMDPVPAYEHCSDPGDATQLTDGVYTEGYFWVQPSTVGWQNIKPVIVIVDLGAVKAIRGVSYNTAAGVAGVAFPMTIHVMVAGEDKAFHVAGELTGLDAVHGLPPANGYTVHRYWTDGLKTHGRYVAFVTGAQPYLFCDEVEVYEGDAAWMTEPLPGESIGDLKNYVKTMQIYDGIARRLRADCAEVRKEAEESAVPDDVRQKVAGQLDAIIAEMPRMAAPPVEGFRSVFPLNDLHARVFLAQAQVWESLGKPALQVWQSPLWDMDKPVFVPPAEGKAVVNVAMMSNEYRAASFNLSNATQAPMEAALRIKGLPGGDNPGYLTVHEVLWTDTQTGKPVAAALPEARRAGDAYLVTLTPGLTRQVWLTFHPVDVPPGRYEGSIEIAAGPDTLQVPISLQVYPVRFPDAPRLHCGGWDYTGCGGSYGVTAANRDAYIAHLRARYVDSPWANPCVFPHGKHDAQGHQIEPPDTSVFDEWVQQWPNAAQYCVFIAVSDRWDSWLMGSAEFETAVKEWALFWADHVRGKGIQPAQMPLLVFDEPREPAHDAIILAWAKVLHACGAGFPVWEDPIYFDMSEASPETIAACDVLCPNRQLFLNAKPEYRAYFAERRDKGTQLEFYSCSGPARLLDPYAYYRLQPWTCWQEGAQASYYWAFGDTGGANSWNEYALPRNAYCPLFLDDTTVTAGKQMEAIREGIEDYEYLAMLWDAIQAAESAGKTGDVIAKAKALLTDGPQRVLETGGTPLFGWSDDIDRTVADTVRVEILEALTALK